MTLRKSESFPLGAQKGPRAANTENNSEAPHRSGFTTPEEAGDLSDEYVRCARIAYRREKGEDVSDEGPISDDDETQIARWRPARDFEQFRRWRDQHASPETIAEFEEARRRWHERNDPPK